MAYVKILYQDSPSTATPLNAQNLNHMDDGIAENDRRLNELATAGVVNTFNSRTGNVTSEKGDYDIDQIVESGGQEGYIPVWRNSGTEQEPDWGFAMEEMGGSGHEILDADGTSMAQEDALQFVDSFVSDDSVNGRTIVENVKEVDPADYASTTDEGIIVTDDGDDALIGPMSDDHVEVTGDGDKTYQTLLNELFNEVDEDKINENALLLFDDNLYQRVGYTAGSEIEFSFVSLSSQKPYIDVMRIKPSNSIKYHYYNETFYDDSVSEKPSNGKIIRLYYGNKKATVDLQTTANRCLMSDGVTSVEGALNNIVQFNVTPDSNGNAKLTGYLWSEYLPLVGRCTNTSDVEISYISAEFASIGDIWIHARDVKTNAPITSAITIVIAFLKV